VEQPSAASKGERAVERRKRLLRLAKERRRGSMRRYRFQEERVSAASDRPIPGAPAAPSERVLCSLRWRMPDERFGDIAIVRIRQRAVHSALVPSPKTSSAMSTISQT
jgi:hypothetical protein